MANRRKNRQISFRCTEEEYEWIHKKIAASRKGNTAFLLETLRNKEIVVYPGLLGILAELKQEGVNLNQALRYTHRDHTIHMQLKSAICHCNELYQKYLELWKDSIQ